VLKPNGKLIITTPNNEDLDFSTNFCPDCGCIYHKYQHIRTWSSDSLNNKLNEYSFNIFNTQELSFKNSNTTFLSSLKYNLKEMMGKNKINLYGVFSK
jgi:hypothetical protein